MNQYLKNLSKIEFVVTYACTGRCKHCSEGEHTSCGERINPGIAADAVRKIVAEYDIKTVMTFGGEPLLYTDAVYAIMTTAKELNIPKRQVITNGYFSKNAYRIREVAEDRIENGYFTKEKKRANRRERTDPRINCQMLSDCLNGRASLFWILPPFFGLFFLPIGLVDWSVRSARIRSKNAGGRRKSAGLENINFLERCPYNGVKIYNPKK